MSKKHTKNSNKILMFTPKSIDNEYRAYMSTKKYYTQSHQWVEVTGNLARFGVTEYAQQAYGDILFIEVHKSLGDTVQQGEAIGMIEALKSVSEIEAPVSGKLFELNKEIASGELQSKWIGTIELANAEEYTVLMDEVAYNKYISE